MLLILLLCVSLCYSRIIVPRSPSIHVVGMSGHGKSTIARSLTNDNELISGNIETTTKRMASFSKTFDMLIYDYPGFGSPEYSLRRWLREYKPRSIVLLVIGNRIYEQHKKFLQYFRRTRLIVVRSQMDIFPIDERIFKKYCRNTLQLKRNIPILFFNLKQPLEFQRKLQGVIV